MAFARTKAKVQELERENESLRKSLGLDRIESPERWAEHVPQAIRDRMAAMVLIAEKLDEPRALRRLGFTVERNNGRLEPIVWEWCEKVFGTPGVREQLSIDMADAEKNKSEIIGRLVQTARFGDDGESVRAAQQLSKMADWNEGDKAVAKAGAAQILNLMQLAGDRPKSITTETFDPDKTLDAAKFLDHEPSAEGVAVEDIEEAV